MAVKLGVVGAGGIGKHHMESIRAIEGAKLVAFSELDEALGKSVSDQFGVKWYRDYIEMSEREEPDGITIALPHHLHSKTAIDVMRMGVNVLVEKPMAVRVSEADQMIAQAQRSHVKLGVVFQYRLMSLPKLLKRTIEEETLGKLVRAHLIFNVFRSQGYYLTAPWRGTWRGEGGGVLINQGIHHIDLFQWLIGKNPETCYALTDTVFHHIEVEDMASALIKFDEGIQATVQLSSIDSPEMVQLDVRGDRGKADLTENKLTLVKNSESLKFWGASDAQKYMWMKPEHTVEEVTAEGESDPHHLVIGDFVDSLTRDRSPAVSGEEGLKSLELVNAIIMSGQTGEVINFPVDRGRYDTLLRSLSSN